MLKKGKYILGILIICCLLLFTGCSVRKNVRNKEVKEFTKSILESNKKVKDLSFYFIRPYLGGELVYDGDLDKQDFQNLIHEFDEKIDIEFMQRIGDKYWGGSRPSSFVLYIYVDNKRNDKNEHTYDYLISSRYNKTHVHDENPENIDGYKTWKISDNKNRAIIIDADGDKRVEAWGVGLNTKNITSTGLTLTCYQSVGEPTGELSTDSYYFLEEKINDEWVPIEILPSEYERAWTDEAWIIPTNDEVEWEVNWKELYGELSAGYYRIGKNIRDFRDTSDYDEEIYFANFEVLN